MSIFVHKVFGLIASDADSIARALDDALDLAFVPHESSYLGEYLLHEGADGFKVAVSSNMDPMYLPGDPEEEMYFHPDFPQHSVLISVTVSESVEPHINDVVSAIDSHMVVISRDAA